MAKHKCRECGNMYTAYTELGAWPICPACKRAKEDQKEQKKQTALQQELLEKQLEATKAEERRQNEEAARQRRMEEERIRIEQEKARKELEIAEQKEKERKSQEAKKRINEISEKIISENKGMLLVGFTFQNNYKYEKNDLIDEKDSNGFYLDILELTGSSIILDKIDLVGFKKVSDKWQNYVKYDNGKFLYYFSSQNNEVEKILFLKKEEIEQLEKILTDIDNEIIRQEKDRIRAEQAAREKQEKENEINHIISTAIKFNTESAFSTNQKLLLLFKFSDDINKSLKDYNYFIEILQNQKSKTKILKFIKQNEDILSVISTFDTQYEKVTKDLLLFENAIFGKTKKFDNILKTHNITKENLSKFLSKFNHINKFLPKTKKFINTNVENITPDNFNIDKSLEKDVKTEKKTVKQQKNENLKPTETLQENMKSSTKQSTGFEYLDTILDGGKLVIISVSGSLLSSIFFIAGIASFNFIPFGFIGHVITIPILIYIRFKRKIKIWPIMIIFAISFIIAIAVTPSDNNNIDSNPKTKIENKK